MKNKCIGFIGLGLIGGSIAKSIKKFYRDIQLVAYNRTYSVLEAAKAEGIVDVICGTVDERFADCDYIFLCMPVTYNITYLTQIQKFLKKECIITDVGSVKTDVHMHVSNLGLEENFIGGHPMTGSEKTGYEYSTDHLIENAYYILTPSEKVSSEAVTAFYDFIESLGAIPMILNPLEHDYMTATVSHVPHIIASSLVHLVKHSDNQEETMKTIAAGGFKDLTRIASGSPIMWQQICLTNSENIFYVLSNYIDSLEQMKLLFSNKDEAAILSFFEEAAQYRDTIPSRKGLVQPLYELYCDVQDEAGSIATVATSLAVNQINIKNIGIIHNREFEYGALHIEFYEQSALNDAVALLEKQGLTTYHPI